MRDNMSQLVTFGPFSLFPRERRLEHGGQAVKVGSRALDILIALTERAGEVVSREALVARVWPDTIVEESALAVADGDYVMVHGRSAEVSGRRGSPSTSFASMGDVSQSIGM